MSARLTAPDGAGASLRELAAAAGVSQATIRHYVGDRPGAIRAVLEHHHQLGEEFLRLVAAEPLGDLRSSVARYLQLLLEGVRAGVGALLQVGIGNGRADPQVARACLSEVLEPTLQSLEVRLQRHIAAGQMRETEVRFAALQLVAPLVLALVHQDDLDGATYRPLDVAAFIAHQTDAFVRAYGR
jgi:AcrR family transcriptional regulator